MSPWSQLFGHFPFRIKTKKRLVAMTFDDGPNEPYTTQIAEYLHKKQISGTFFLVGECLKRYPKTAAKLVKLGHVIGNHSTSHRFGASLSTNAYQQEIESTQNLIYSQIRKRPLLFRPPWLLRTPGFLNRLLQHGLSVVSGEFCHPLEVAGINAKSIAKLAVLQTKPGTILIFHDGDNGKTGNRLQTVEALKLVVTELQRLNYLFVSVDELLGVKPYEIN